MGVPQFFSFLKRRYREAIQRSFPTEVSSLAIDMNSLFHQAAGLTYGYAEDETIESLKERKYEKRKREKQAEETEPQILKMELFSNIWTMVINIMNQVRPQDALIIAVDGMAPMGKIQQQRQRRYKSSLERRSKIFDSNAFSPGTDLMIELDKFLRRKLLSLDRNVSEAIFVPYKVIYSGHLDPGEGEHKIMEYYRKGWPEGFIAADGGSHIIHGLDADLIMLSMLLPQKRVFLMRRNVTEIINIDRLHESISIDLGTPTAVDDFLVLMYFIGNDFLPRIKTLDRITEVAEALIETYREVGKSLTLADGEEINWVGLAFFLRSFKKLEPGFAQGLSEIQYTFPSYVIESATHPPPPQKGGIVNFHEFRNEWYSYALAAPLGSKNIIDNLKIPKTLVQPTKEQIQNMGLEFLTGMAWTSLYYRKGMTAINKEWSYPYFYAPLLVDLAVIAGYVAVKKTQVKQYKHFPGVINYNVIHQMLSILPPSSKNLVPKEVQPFYLSQSPIIDQFPDSFKFDEDGKHEEWQLHALVPHVNIHRIYVVTEYVPFSRRTKETLSPQDVTIQVRKTKSQIVNKIQPPFGRWAPERERGPSRGRGQPIVGNWEERERERRQERGRERERPLTGDVRVTERKVETEKRVEFKEAAQPLSGDVKQVRFRPQNRVHKVRPLKFPLRPRKTKTPLQILAQFDIDYSSLTIIFE